MEHQNFGNENVKSSRRRLSSILKAPRTSMKVLQDEPEEQKEEISKPVEKKRNSRRVSFASTNNVRVFTNDAKNESPVLSSVQNTHGDRLDEKSLRYDDDGSHQIKGLETLLNTPLYLSQHKDNFFSDPVLQDDCVDRTMLLGDETGFMDMTHIHTIIIDKNNEIEEEANQNFKVAQNFCGDPNIASQKDLPSEVKAEKKNTVKDSDFGAFLASMRLPPVNITKIEKSEKDIGNVFYPENTIISETDKENYMPSFFMKQHSGGKSHQQQQRGLQRRRSRVSFIEDGEIEQTKSHTVVIENMSFTPTVTPSAPFMTPAYSDVSDDMGLTCSQTAVIDVKMTGNITRSVQAALDHSKSNNLSEDENAMEMTGAFDVSVRGKDHTVSMMEQGQSSVHKVKSMSSLTVIGNGETADRNKSGYFQGNLSIARAANADDMEMTGALDVSIREKEEALFPKMSRRPAFDAFGNGKKGEDKYSSSLIVPAANDDMEMTEAIPSSVNQPLINSRKSLPLASVSRTVQEDDMDITQCQTIFLKDKQSTENKSVNNVRNFSSVSSSKIEHTGSMKKALCPASSVSKMPCFNSVKNDVKIDPNNQPSNHAIAHTANSTDMDITQCQTIFLEAKPSTECKSVNNFWNLTSASASRSAQEDEHTGSMKKNALCPTSRVSKMPCFNLGKNEVKMDPTNQPGNLTVAHTPNSADMDITHCLTFLARPSTESKSFNNILDFPSASSSRTAREYEHTDSLKKETLCPPSSVCKIPCFNLVRNKVNMDPTDPPGNLSIPQTANSDDMEMTQCQTIFLDANHVSGDQSLSISRKTGPHMSVSETESSDGMSMTHVFTGRIILNDHSASTKEKDESSVIPVSTTSPQHNDSEFMELTCQPNAFSEISHHRPDELELTACTTDMVSNETCLGRVVDITDVRNRSSADQTIRVVEPMEMTEVCMGVISERKHKAFMTRRKSGARMMSLMCNAGDTEADNCQTGFSNSDDMDMTRSQTAVLDFKTIQRATQFSKSMKRLNIASTSFTPDSDGMEMTQALTGNIVLSRFAPNEESKHNINKSCEKQDESDCMEMTCQACESNLTIPCADDEIELMGSKTIAVDLKSTLATSAAEIKAHESALWASTSVPRCTVLSENQNEVSEVAKRANTSVSPSKHFCDLDEKNNKETIFNSLPDLQKGNSCQMALPSSVIMSDEDNDMQVTKVLTLTIENEQSVLLNQREDAKRDEEEEQAPSPNKEQHGSSVQLDISSTDSFLNVELRDAKARRRSLADFQMKLHSMSQRIQEEHKLVMGSTTAPLPSCTFSEISLKEQRELESSTEPASKATPLVKQKNSSFQNEKTTPFSQTNKSFSSRMSLCGIVPKLPKRATVTPSKTMNISNDFHCLQLEKPLDVAEQKSNNETVDINDEELPEMSSEEDLSESLENCPFSQRDELDGALAVPIREESFVDDVFESATKMSACFKRPHPEEDPITGELTKKACVSDTGSDCHEAAVQWEGNFTRHATQNPKAKTIEDTGVSESTLRYSQFDSHMDGTLDNLFDFNKKLEDGSMTVNEFLSHFGINFIIHRPRPSALPDTCRAGETRTMEDLLREKYIYHPRQRVYEQDCKNLTEIVERLKEQMTEQEKPLRSINEALQQEICTLSKEQLKSFGSKLKERRAYFGKRSKALSHEMKVALYTELIKTTKDSKLSLISKIKEIDGMTEDLDGCIKDLQTELASVNAMITGDLEPPQSKPALKAKEEDLQRLNSAVTNKEREIGEMEIQLRNLKSRQEKVHGESSSLKSHLATLNSLNEWRLDAADERGALFSFLHKSVLLQVNLQTPAGKEWMTEDVERNIDVCFQLQLDVQKSECHASMVHKLLALKIEPQTQWTQRYTTVRHIPELLHNISLMVGRLRLLGEEIHRLKKWGGLRLRILKISCKDTRIHIIFSSLKAFEKFELSLAVTPDYPFGPLHIQDFKKHMGNTRLDQLEEIISSVTPAKNYLTKVLKKIHDDLLS